MRWSAKIVLAVAAVAALPLASARLAPYQTAPEALGLARALAARSEAQVREEGALGFYGRALLADALARDGLRGELPREEAVAAMDALLRQLRAPVSGEPFRDTPTSVAYRAHLALAQEGRLRLAAADAATLALHGGQLEALAKEVQHAPGHLLPSYGARTFPADNEVLLAALTLAATRTGAPELRSAAAALQESLAALERTGLPPSEVEPGTLAARAGPRGCAIAWTVAVRGTYDPVAARELYGRARPALWMSLGPVAAFREWPRGDEGEADADSGPVLFGVGTSATALASVAAGAAGRPGDARALGATVRAGWPLIGQLAQGQRTAANAIAAWSRSSGP